MKKILRLSNPYVDLSLMVMSTGQPATEYYDEIYDYYGRRIK